MKKSSVLFMGMTVLSLMIGLLGCGTGPDTQNEASSTTQRSQPQQKDETQWEKYQRLIRESGEKIVVGSDNMATIESIEAVYQPQVITKFDEITTDKLVEPGRPYCFKIRAIYKGHDLSAERILLQDLEQSQSSVMGTAFGELFGVDTDVYQMEYPASIVSTFPTDANAIATFYLIAVRFTQTEQDGKKVNPSYSYVRYVRNIEKPFFDPSKFIVANGMHYITVKDAHVPTQQDAMASYFFGGARGDSLQTVFDPIVYPLADLMDARVAMDKKDIRYGDTFPTVPIKYVSELIFKGQSNTTITVSTADNILTERMNFTGRASSISNGQKVRVYYTIAKNPLEKWEIQAIERL
jgi:hypothetical protein